VPDNCRRTGISSVTRVRVTDEISDEIAAVRRVTPRVDEELRPVCGYVVVDRDARKGRLMTAPAATPTSSYVLDQSWYAERDRLRSLTDLYDQTSLQLCERLGLADGWACLDVGAGTGSLVELLADRVGESGLVVGADIDVRFLQPIERPNVEVLRLDITKEPPPRADFDLVHARLLLEHLPQRDDLLLVLSLLVRPGGYLLIEDFDWATAMMFDPASDVGEQISAAVRTVMMAGGYEAQFGRRLPRLFAAAGLTDVQTHAQAAQVRGDRQRGIPQWQLLIEQLSSHLLASGLVTQGDLDEFDAQCHDEDFVCFAPLMVSVSGRRS
jgi:SAM-dependent methyltransferase